MANQSAFFEGVEVIGGGFAGAIVDVKWVEAQVVNDTVVLVPVTRTGGTLKVPESGKLTPGTLMPASVLGLSEEQFDTIRHHLYLRRRPGDHTKYENDEDWF